MNFKMKDWKTIASVFLLGVVMVLFTSCLSSNEYKPVAYAFFTINRTTTSASGIVLVQDLTGHKFYPSAKSVTDLGGLKGLERAFLEFTFQDGEKYVEGKTEFKIDLVNYGRSFGIQTKSLCTRPDTLCNDSISKFSSMWADRGYVTTLADVYVSDRVFVDMTKEGIGNDTLYLKLNQNLLRSENNKNGYKVDYAYNSFRLPSSDDLRKEGIQTKEDSIVVAVSAKVAKNRSAQTEYLYCKYKLD